MNTRSRLNVTTTQRLALNTGLVTALKTLRADALGLTRYLEEAAAANPALVLQPALPVPYEWLPRWTQAFAAPAPQDVLAAAAPSLIAHVMNHITATLVTPQDHAIAVCFAEALEPSGWLGRPVGAIATEAGCSMAHALDVLARLQQIEPRGLFARSLAECLHLQAAEAGVADQPMIVMLDHLDVLAQGDFARLSRLAQVSTAEIMARLGIIRSFDPKPGAGFVQGAAPVREPDLVARKQDGGWHIGLNHSALPTLGLAGDAKAGARAQARAVIALVQARNQTLLRVGQEVLFRQWRALENGLGGVVPLRMADVAETLGFHESTVSRAVAGTAVDTPRGTWWLRDLFSRDMGDGQSAVALRSRLAALIAAENAASPLSDLALAQALSQDGAQVARRTVAKYRGLLRIGAAHQRRIRPARKGRFQG
jgi:RNA polymerase sigma-54 factor